MERLQRRATMVVRCTGQLPCKNRASRLGFLILQLRLFGEKYDRCPQIKWGKKNSIDKWEAKFKKDKWNWCTEWKTHLASAKARNRSCQTRLDLKQTRGGDTSQNSWQIGGLLAVGCWGCHTSPSEDEVSTYRWELLRVTEQIKQNRLKKIHYIEKLGGWKNLRGKYHLCWSHGHPFKGNCWRQNWARQNLDMNQWNHIYSTAMNFNTKKKLQRALITGLKKKRWLIRKITLDSGIGGKSFWKKTVVPSTHHMYLEWLSGKSTQVKKKPKPTANFKNFSAVL